MEKFTSMTRELYAYLVEHGAPRDEVLIDLEAETRDLGEIAVMQTAPEQGALMTLLVRMLGVGRALEIGTFMGYGAICIARGLEEGGRLVTCEVDEQRATAARRWFARAGLDSRIDLVVGPALETLRGLPQAEPFDFAYIDADKLGYPAYYEECLRLLRPGGALMIDNVLLSGRVLDPVDDDSAAAVAHLNERIAADPRVEATMLGISDGVTLALKR